MSTTAQDDTAAAMTVAAMVNDNSYEQQPISAPTLPPMPSTLQLDNNTTKQKRAKKKCNYIINESTNETCNNIALKDGVCKRHGAKFEKAICGYEGCTNQGKFFGDIRCVHFFCIANVYPY